MGKGKKSYHVWLYISTTFVFYSLIIIELNKIQCNYDFAHISPLVLNEAHIALQGEGSDSRTAQYMDPSVLAILVQT